MPAQALISRDLRFQINFCQMFFKNIAEHVVTESNY